MSVCAQSSQRTTWPPRVAVRQFSIADITFNCSRLTRPTLALRHVGPCSRKTSATSSAGRGTDAADQVDFLRLLRRFACFSDLGPLHRFGRSLEPRLSSRCNLPAGLGPLNWLWQLRASALCSRDQMFKRTGDLLDGFGGDLGVDGRRVQFGVAKQHLDHPNVDFALEQMGGEGMPQAVRRYPLGDAGDSCGLKASASDLALAER